MGGFVLGMGSPLGGLVSSLDGESWRLLRWHFSRRPGRFVGCVGECLWQVLPSAGIQVRSRPRVVEDCATQENGGAIYRCAGLHKKKVGEKQVDVMEKDHNS